SSEYYVPLTSSYRRLLLLLSSYFSCPIVAFSFLFTPPAPSEIYTLSLHDALPILVEVLGPLLSGRAHLGAGRIEPALTHLDRAVDRKSTRLNSSHEWISYAVFCLKKKK